MSGNMVCFMLAMSNPVITTEESRETGRGIAWCILGFLVFKSA